MQFVLNQEKAVISMDSDTKNGKGDPEKSDS